MLPTVLEGAAKLEAAGVSTAVVNLHTVKPLDEAFLTRAFASFSVIASIEEHGLIGGLGAALAEWKVDHNAKARLLRFGTADAFLHESGGTRYARARNGLTSDAILQRVTAAVRP